MRDNNGFSCSASSQCRLPFSIELPLLHQLVPVSKVTALSSLPKVRYQSFPLDAKKIKDIYFSFYQVCGKQFYPVLVPCFRLGAHPPLTSDFSCNSGVAFSSHTFLTYY